MRVIREMTLSEALTHLRQWHSAMGKTQRRTVHMMAIRAILRHFGE